MPPPDPNAPDSPPLRGLNPTALVNILGTGKRTRPNIPGWEIENILGEGGLGIVWRARRISDNAVAAIKVPRLSEIEHLERLEHEATTLRALTHPHIVRLLESGPLDDGGMFLAMEFIDGPALSHALPAVGFDPARAYEIFHQIAAATAHAHAQNVIHRDLKPANILLAPDGTARVADFGLARPVHERVQHLSLTQTGLIAGTAEYLPPEAYRSGYVPGVKGDIYALGIILHELLTGSPPRGAWRAVSQQRRTDIRVDEILQKALAPDPAHRWSSVDEMDRALTEIHRTPARYSGTPLITPAIRTADCLWTIAGLLILIAAIGVFARLGLARVPMPIDLIGQHGLRTGGFQALFFLLLAMTPLAVWQLVRLRRFRSIPMREALPSPFGIRLDSSLTTATLVLTGQLACFILPIVLLAEIALTVNGAWLQAGDPPWRHGLIVTHEGNSIIVSPWQWPKSGQHYWLRECTGVIGTRLANPIDHIDFLPAIVPALMLAMSGVIGFTLLATLGSAVHRSWWKKPARAVGLALLTCTGALAVSALRLESWLDENRLPSAQADARQTLSRHFGPLQKLCNHLFPSQPPEWTALTEPQLDLYAPEVYFRDFGKISREQVATLLKQQATADRAAHTVREQFDHRPRTADGDPGWLISEVRYIEYADPPAGDSFGAILIVTMEGPHLPGIGASLERERMDRTPLYTTDQRPLPKEAAAVWVSDFHTALAPPKTGPDPLMPLLLPQMLLAKPRIPNAVTSREEFVTSLRAARDQPVPLSEPTETSRLPGARHRIAWSVRDPSTGNTATWTAELVFTENRWQALRLIF